MGKDGQQIKSMTVETTNTGERWHSCQQYDSLCYTHKYISCDVLCPGQADKNHFNSLLNFNSDF